MADSFRGYIVDELQLRESFKFRTNSSLHLQIAWQNVTDLLGLPYQKRRDDRAPDKEITWAGVIDHLKRKGQFLVDYASVFHERETGLISARQQHHGGALFSQ